MRLRLLLLTGVLLLILMASAAPAQAFTLTVTSVDPAAVKENGSAIVTVGGSFSTDTSALTPTFRLEGPRTVYGGTLPGWTATSATVQFDLSDDYRGVYDLAAEQYVYGAATPYTATLPGAFTVYPDLAISGLSPDTCPADHGDLTLTVYGDAFVGAGPVPALHPSVVRWNGTAVPTTVNSSTMLTAVVPAASLIPGTALVTVFNQGMPPLAESEVSNARPFLVTAVTPTITAVNPASAAAGGPAFDLTVTGTRFIAGSVVRWNAETLPTTFLSTTQVKASVPASAIAAAGGAQVTVRNGAEGAPVSNAVTFPVRLALPALTGITPAQVWAGYVRDDLVLTVTGTGFASGAHVLLGATEKAATAFVSVTQLTVPLTAADIASPGTIAVGVKNPDGALAPVTRPLAVVAETTTPSVTIAGADNGWHNSPVTLTFSASDTQSGIQKVQYRCPPGVSAWADGASCTVPTSTQGSVLVSVQALDWCNAAGTASATVRIDTTQPRTQAQNAVSVRRGRTAKLKYRVSEPADLSPTADVVIQVKKAGRVVKTFRFDDTPMNSDRTYSFRCTLRKGSYRWYVYATDLAGNQQASAASNSLRVR